MGTSASRLNHAAKFCVPHICDTGQSTIGIHGVCVDRVAEMIFLVRKADRPGVYVVTGDEEYLDRLESYPGRRLVSTRNMLDIYRYISSYRSRQFKLSTAEHDATKSGFWRIVNANRTATTMKELLLDDFERSLLGCDLSRNAFTPRVFFMTELGLFGICSKWTRKGDHVVFFGGRPKPYTLRPVDGEDGQRRWKLIGDCFIEDCMEGHYFEPETYDTCGKEYDKDAERISDERFLGRTKKLREEQFILC